MNLCITNAVQSEIGVKDVASIPEIDDTTWHCTIDYVSDYKVLIITHVNTKYTIGMFFDDHAEDMNYTSVIIDGIKQTMLYEGFTESIIDSFIGDDTSIQYYKTNNRSIIAQTTKQKHYLFIHAKYIDYNHIQQPILNHQVNETNLDESPHNNMVNVLQSLFPNRNVIVYSHHEIDVTIEINEDYNVSRRLLVPSTYTLHDLHELIQTAFGWKNSHLHEFINKKTKKTYSPFDDIIEQVVYSPYTISVKEAFEGFSEWQYIYDFGDYWVHEIFVRLISYIQKKPKPFCLASKNENIPEDVGGIPGLEHFLEVIDDPNHPEYNDMVHWLQTIEHKKFNQNMLNISLIEGIPLHYISSPYVESEEDDVLTDLIKNIHSS